MAALLKSCEIAKCQINVLPGVLVLEVEQEMLQEQRSVL